jgi:hypothetical protein
VSDEKTPAEPPGGWPRVRTDAGARVLVARIDALSERLEGFVTHKQMMAWAGAFAVTLIAAVWILASRAENRAEAAGAKAVSHAKEAVISIQGEVSEVRSDVQAIREESRKDNQALYNFLLTRRKQPRLEPDGGGER